VKVVVTGGAGFIGSAFVRDALNGEFLKIGIEPAELIVIDKLTYAGSMDNLADVSNDKRFRFHQEDIVSAKAITPLVRGADLLVNFAAESHVDRSIENSDDFIQSNIVGVQNLLNCSLKNGVKRFLQVSTDEVYGSIEEGYWDENFPVSPNSPYSASKASADLLVLASHRTHGQDVVITRCSNNYGPNQHLEKLIPKLISRLLDGKDLPIYGDGSNLREWIHVSDHVKAIAYVSVFGKKGEIYNVGTQNHISNLELCELLMDLVKSHTSKIRFVEDRPGHDFRYALNTDKLKSLGFVPTKDFSEGLLETLEWYQTNSNSV
jgi:dTDP-glucose 4,6-dehydratase